MKISKMKQIFTILRKNENYFQNCGRGRGGQIYIYSVLYKKFFNEVIKNIKKYIDNTVFIC